MDNPEAMLDLLSMETFRHRFGLHSHEGQSFYETGFREKAFQEKDFQFPEERDQLELFVRDLCIDDSISYCFASSESELEKSIEDKVWLPHVKHNSPKRTDPPHPRCMPQGADDDDGIHNDATSATRLHKPVARKTFVNSTSQPSHNSLPFFEHCREERGHELSTSKAISNNCRLNSIEYFLEASTDELTKFRLKEMNGSDGPEIINYDIDDDIRLSLAQTVDPAIQLAEAEFDRYQVSLSMANRHPQNSFEKGGSYTGVNVGTTKLDDKSDLGVPLHDKNVITSDHGDNHLSTSSMEKCDSVSSFPPNQIKETPRKKSVFQKVAKRAGFGRRKSLNQSSKKKQTACTLNDISNTCDSASSFIDCDKDVVKDQSGQFDQKNQNCLPIDSMLGMCHNDYSRLGKEYTDRSSRLGDKYTDTDCHHGNKYTNTDSKLVNRCRDEDTPGVAPPEKIYTDAKQLHGLEIKTDLENSSSDFESGSEYAPKQQTDLPHENYNRNSNRDVIVDPSGSHRLISLNNVRFVHRENTNGSERTIESGKKDKSAVRPWYEIGVRDDLEPNIPKDRSGHRQVALGLRDVIEEAARVKTPESDTSIISCTGNDARNNEPSLGNFNETKLAMTESPSPTSNSDSDAKVPDDSSKFSHQRKPQCVEGFSNSDGVTALEQDGDCSCDTSSWSSLDDHIYSNETQGHDIDGIKSITNQLLAQSKDVVRLNVRDTSMRSDVQTTSTINAEDTQPSLPQTKIPLSASGMSTTIDFMAPLCLTLPPRRTEPISKMDATLREYNGDDIQANINPSTWSNKSKNYIQTDNSLETKENYSDAIIKTRTYDTQSAGTKDAISSCSSCSEDQKVSEGEEESVNIGPHSDAIEDQTLPLSFDSRLAQNKKIVNPDNDTAITNKDLAPFTEEDDQATSFSDGESKPIHSLPNAEVCNSSRATFLSTNNQNENEDQHRKNARMNFAERQSAKDDSQGNADPDKLLMKMKILNELLQCLSKLYKDNPRLLSSIEDAMIKAEASTKALTSHHQHQHHHHIGQGAFGHLDVDAIDHLVRLTMDAPDAQLVTSWLEQYLNFDQFQGSLTDGQNLEDHAPRHSEIHSASGSNSREAHLTTDTEPFNNETFSKIEDTLAVQKRGRSRSTANNPTISSPNLKNSRNESDSFCISSDVLYRNDISKEKETIDAHGQPPITDQTLRFGHKDQQRPVIMDSEKHSMSSVNQFLNTHLLPPSRHGKGNEEAWCLNKEPVPVMCKGTKTEKLSFIHDSVHAYGHPQGKRADKGKRCVEKDDNDEKTHRSREKTRKRWGGLSLLPHHLKKKIERLSQKGKKKLAAASGPISGSSSSRSSSIGSSSGRDVVHDDRDQYSRRSFGSNSSVNAIVNFKDNDEDERQENYFNDHNCGSNSVQLKYTGSSITLKSNSDQELRNRFWRNTRRTHERKKPLDERTNQSMRNEIPFEISDNGRFNVGEKRTDRRTGHMHSRESSRGSDFWSSDEHTVPSLREILQQNGSDKFTSVSDMGLDCDSSDSMSGFHNQRQNNNRHLHNHHHLDDDHIHQHHLHHHLQHHHHPHHRSIHRQDELQPDFHHLHQNRHHRYNHHPHHHPHHRVHHRRRHRRETPGASSSRRRSRGDSNGSDEDDDEDDDSDDSDASEDPRARVDVDNEEWPDEMLRVQRLAKHLDSVQRLHFGNSHLIETVVASTGQVLTSQENRSREPSHVNMGEAYPFSPHDVKGFQTTSRAKRTTSPGGLVGRRAKIHLFNHEKLRSDDGMEGKQGGDVGASPSDLSRQCQEMDKDVPWDLLAFSDSDDTEFDDRKSR